MNDKNLKDFLKQDQSMPKAPQQEWSQILLKIESRSKYSNFTFFKKPVFLFSILVVMIFSILNLKKFYNISQSEEITAYLFEDDYFLESDELYTWVE